jgi:hypothetical protein
MTELIFFSCIKIDFANSVYFVEGGCNGLDFSYYNGRYIDGNMFIFPTSFKGTPNIKNMRSKNVNSICLNRFIFIQRQINKEEQP